MRKLTILGTGCAMVTRCYNTCFVVSNGDAHLLVDAGGGNQVLAHLEQTGIPVDGIHDIFVSHRHNDHTVGMIWMVRAITTQMLKGTYNGDLNIFCTAETAQVIRSICYPVLQSKFTDHFDRRIHFRHIEAGSRADIIGWSFSFFDIGSKKDQQFGFEMRCDDGYRMTYLGDEPYRDEAEVYAKNTDMLLHEAYCLYSDKDVYRPYDLHHATAKDAAENADRLGAKSLLLYHTEDDYLGRRKEVFQTEAKRSYDGAVFVPDDLEVIEF